jgi:trehalose 6-phosphate synthase
MVGGHHPRDVVIVANRGPNDFVWQDDGWRIRRASGGLVSMLEPLARRPGVTWVCCVSEPPRARQARHGLFTTASDQADSGLNVVPVPLPADVYHRYYGMVSNEVLWMLQHGIIGPGGHDFLDHARHRAWDEGYLAANHQLAAAIARIPGEERAFLVQDYHLYPLPALLRTVFPSAPILHFTHIPFPGPPTLRLLPPAWRSAILRGLLGSDVVGLQTHADVHAFLACCETFLPGEAVVDTAQRIVQVPDGRTVRVCTFPASIDLQELRETMRSGPVAAARERLRPHLAEQVIVRVDRMDPSKNQLVGFLAFGRLLEMRPELRGRVRFLAFLVPSRTDLRVYRTYRDSVYQAIQSINSRFQADCGGPPVEVFYTNDREQALAAMELCDVLLVNSWADGMNLVAKEWAVVSQRPGVLVVSETAGVAEEAGPSSLLCTPLDVDGTAVAMSQALDMPTAERSVRLEGLRTRVTHWTASDWLAAQLRNLGFEE